MADGTTSSFYAARPNLSLDGEAMPGLSVGVLSIAVHETVEGLFTCELTLGNWGITAGEIGFLYFDRQVVDFGRTLAVTMGDGDAGGSIFEGRIMALEGRFPEQSPPELLVLAEDRLQDLRMTRRSRQFEQATFGDVVQQVASEHGLQGQADVDSPTYPVLAQVNQSDLKFLRDGARAVDAEIWLDGTTLHAQARARRRRDEVSLTFGQRLKEFAVTADLAGQRTSVVGTGWDRTGKAAIRYEANGAAIANEVGAGTSGIDILDSAVGARVEQRVHHVPLNDQEGQTLAEAHLRRLARRFVTGRGMADGDVRLRVGAKLTLNGLGPLFEGAYYVSEVRHLFDVRDGFRTQFCVERAGLGGN